MRVTCHLYNVLPWDKCQVCVGKLVSDQPWTILTLVLFLQVALQNGGHAFDLFVVALLGTGKLLRVEFGEPRSLSVVGTLSAHW